MSSNNPFAASMGEYKHHRDPPPPPPTQTPASKPPRPAREKKPAPPPLYAEVAGPDSAKEYPREKSSSSSRPRRSLSDVGHHKSSSRRHKSSRNRSPTKKKVEGHNSKNLDVIDKLDVSAFYGGKFHHDGPFDACAPHRNKNVKAAPVMAFPADGPNNSMKAKVLSKEEHINMAFGNYEPDQNEIVGIVGRNLRSPQPPVPKTNRGSNDPQATMYTPRLNPSVVAFDANTTAEPIHGLTTAGLGSSTFLDGAPAPRQDDYLAPPNGLGRKKSLVQRLRGNSNSESVSRRSSNDNLGEYSRPAYADEEPASSSLLRRVKSLKVGRR